MCYGSAAGEGKVDFSDSIKKQAAEECMLGPLVAAKSKAASPQGALKYVVALLPGVTTKGLGVAASILSQVIYSNCDDLHLDIFFVKGVSNRCF